MSDTGTPPSAVPPAPAAPAAPAAPDSSAPAAPLARTPLHALHVELGARLVPFAGYAMPVQYPAGVLKEHQHARSQAGLFDVSHMGQVELVGAGADRALETLVPVDVVGLAPGQQRYALFTNAAGGILDDLMVTRHPTEPDTLYLVVNAACRDADIAHLRQHLSAHCTVRPLPERALLALQGPEAARALERLVRGVDFAAWRFMTARPIVLGGVACFASRSGYTGEDGFEISMPADAAEYLASLLLGEPEAAPVGLGARDSLRLEAGLCLYGHDIDTTTTPVEAGLAWAISRARRADGARPGGFPGADRILAQLAGQDLERRRVGLVGVERTPVREGSVIADASGRTVGSVTSGGFGPSAGKAIAMAYVESAVAAPDTPLTAQVRGKAVPMRVAPLPFVPHRYYRG